MSRLQELHPDQQAVLQLVLRRRMSYAALASVLDLPPEGVRERALDAVDGLAPDDVVGLELEDRDRIADHLLGQGDDAEQTATAALLVRSAPARQWATLVATELAALGGPANAVPGSADDAVPTAADGGPQAPAPDDVAGAFAALDAARPARRPRAARPARQGTRNPLAGVGNPLAGRSPRVLAGGAVAAVVVVLLVIWIAGGFGDGSSSTDDADSAAATPPATTTTSTTANAADAAAAQQFVQALPSKITFTAPAGAQGAFAKVSGVAQPTISQQSAVTPVLALSITGLPATSSKRRYFAWADKDGASPIFLGQLTDVRGAELPFQGVDLKTRKTEIVDPTTYDRVRITREGSAAPTKPGPTVIVGVLKTRS